MVVAVHPEQIGAVQDKPSGIAAALPDQRAIHPGSQRVIQVFHPRKAPLCRIAVRLHAPHIARAQFAHRQDIVQVTAALQQVAAQDIVRVQKLPHGADMMPQERHRLQDQPGKAYVFVQGILVLVGHGQQAPGADTARLRDVLPQLTVCGSVQDGAVVHHPHRLDRQDLLFVLQMSDRFGKHPPQGRQCPEHFIQNARQTCKVKVVTHGEQVDMTDRRPVKGSIVRRGAVGGAGICRQRVIPVKPRPLRSVYGRSASL